MEDGAACLTSPIAVIAARHPDLADHVRSYEVVSAEETLPLSAFRQRRFSISGGGCFALLTEGDSAGTLRLHYGIAVPKPATTKPAPQPSTGGVGQSAQLSPEYCPASPVELVVSSLSPSSGTGGLRLILLQRSPPAPPQSPSLAPPVGGGNCSSYECGEDCRSELSSCKLDCFRYGRHEMGSQALCEAGCNQALRSCERSCSIPCPR